MWWVDGDRSQASVGRGQVRSEQVVIVGIASLSRNVNRRKDGGSWKKEFRSHPVTFELAGS